MQPLGCWVACNAIGGTPPTRSGRPFRSATASRQYSSPVSLVSLVSRPPRAQAGLETVACGGVHGQLYQLRLLGSHHRRRSAAYHSRTGGQLGCILCLIVTSYSFSKQIHLMHVLNGGAASLVAVSRACGRASRRSRSGPTLLGFPQHCWRAPTAGACYSVSLSNRAAPTYGNRMPFRGVLLQAECQPGF
jgi:hypothetical protein